MSKLQSEQSSSEASMILRLKNQTKDLQTEYNQLKKILRTQIKAHKSFFSEQSERKRRADNQAKNRLNNLSKQSQSLDRTLEMTNGIIQMGN